MASIRFGAGIVDARGSISGQTFSRNANGSYIRARVAPTNPNTPAQGAARALFGAISSAWKGLTSQQRRSWNEAAQGLLGQYVNRLGEAAQYTGQQLYNKLNNVVALFGGSPLGSAPSPGEVPGVTLASPAGTVDSGELDSLSVTVGTPFSVSPVDILVYASPPGSAGKSRPRSAVYRLINAATGVSAGSLDLLSAYTAVFGDVAAVGDSIWLRVVPAISATGQTGAEVNEQVVLTAAE